MTDSFIKSFFKHIAVTSNSVNFNEINLIVNFLKKLRKNKGRLFFLGVGGSAGNCSHATNDFRKLCNIESYCCTDNISELTARINDDGWNHSFSGWLKASNLKFKDAIFVFSVGGGNLKKKISVNLIEAIKYAKKKKSTVISIVGRKDGYAYDASDYKILIPTTNSALVTPISESFQAVVWHSIVSHPDLQVQKTRW
jgi:D-sedoheptulose 7-phosphate isomerase